MALSQTQKRLNIFMGDLAFDTIGSLRSAVDRGSGCSGEGAEAVAYCQNPDSNSAECWLQGGCNFDIFERPHKYPSSEDTWELLKACGLVDEEMEELIDQQIYEEDCIHPNPNAKEEWVEEAERMRSALRVSRSELDCCWAARGRTGMQELWDEYEMADDFERFEADEARHELLSATPDPGLYMVPDERTVANKEWATMWDGTPPVVGEYPFTTKNIGSSRPENQDMSNKTVNQIDQQNRVIVDAKMTQFGANYHTAMCEFGRIHVPLKFNRYLKEIGEPMKMLVRIKEADRKHPFACIRVL
jgi:hypothetical protein